jgi:hypothetical protein
MIERLRRMDMLKHLTRCGLRYPIVLSQGGTGHCEREGATSRLHPYGVRSICQDRDDGWLCEFGWLWPFC